MSSGFARREFSIPRFASSTQPSISEGERSKDRLASATVVSADLPRVAQLRPGATLHFQFVDVAAAEALARAAEAETRALLASLRPWWPGGLDIDALYTGNLVSGMLHALLPDAPPDARPEST